MDYEVLASLALLIVIVIAVIATELRNQLPGWLALALAIAYSGFILYWT